MPYAPIPRVLPTPILTAFRKAAKALDGVQMAPPSARVAFEAYNALVEENCSEWLTLASKVASDLRRKLGALAFDVWKRQMDRQVQIATPYANLDTLIYETQRGAVHLTALIAHYNLPIVRVDAPAIAHLMATMPPVTPANPGAYPIPIPRAVIEAMRKQWLLRQAFNIVKGAPLDTSKPMPVGDAAMGAVQFERPIPVTDNATALSAPDNNSPMLLWGFLWWAGPPENCPMKTREQSAEVYARADEDARLLNEQYAQDMMSVESAHETLRRMIKDENTEGIIESTNRLLAPSARVAGGSRVLESIRNWVVTILPFCAPREATPQQLDQIIRRHEERLRQGEPDNVVEIGDYTVAFEIDQDTPMVDPTTGLSWVGKANSIRAITSRILNLLWTEQVVVTETVTHRLERRKHPAHVSRTRLLRIRETEDLLEQRKIRRLQIQEEAARAAAAAKRAEEEAAQAAIEAAARAAETAYTYRWIPEHRAIRWMRESSCTTEELQDALHRNALRVSARGDTLYGVLRPVRGHGSGREDAPLADPHYIRITAPGGV